MRGGAPGRNAGASRPVQGPTDDSIFTPPTACAQNIRPRAIRGTHAFRRPPFFLPNQNNVCDAKNMRRRWYCNRFFYFIFFVRDAFDADPGVCTLFIHCSIQERLLLIKIISILFFWTTEFYFDDSRTHSDKPLWIWSNEKLMFNFFIRNIESSPRGNFDQVCKRWVAPNIPEARSVGVGCEYMYFLSPCQNQSPRKNHIAERAKQSLENSFLLQVSPNYIYLCCVSHSTTLPLLILC